MKMRCYRKVLRISYKNHVTNEEVCAEIQQAIGLHEDLLGHCKEMQAEVVWTIYVLTDKRNAVCGYYYILANYFYISLGLNFCCLYAENFSYKTQLRCSGLGHKVGYTVLHLQCRWKCWHSTFRHDPMFNMHQQ